MEVESIDLDKISFGEGLLALGITLDQILDLRDSFVSRKRDSQWVADVPCSEAFVSFENEVRSKSRSNATLTTYQSILRQFYDFCMNESDGRMKVNEIPNYCIGFLIRMDAEKKFKDATWNKYTAVLRRFMFFITDVYFVDNKGLPDFRKQQLPLPLGLRPDAVAELFSVARSSQYAIRSHFFVSFFIMTGVRRAEFRLIQRRDIDVTQQTLLVRHGKGDKERVVPLPEHLIPVITEYFNIYNINNPTDYIFGQIQDPTRPVSLQAIDQVAQRLLSKLSTYTPNDSIYGYHLHSLRHTYATSLLMEGVQL